MLQQFTRYILAYRWIAFVLVGIVIFGSVSAVYIFNGATLPRLALVTGFIIYTGPLYYTLSVVEKLVPVFRLAHKNMRTECRPKPGDEWIRENQQLLDIEQIRNAPWVGIQWYQVNGPQLLCLDPSTIRLTDGYVSVEIENSSHGPLEICLTTQGTHTYRGLPYCRDHGGPVTDEDAVLIKLPNNCLRLVVNFKSSARNDIDTVFRKHKA